MIRGVLIIALIAGTLWGGQSITDDQAAHGHYYSAKAYVDRRHYADSRRDFELSYPISKYPAILYNIGLCHERLGHNKEAIETLRRYLSLDPSSPRRQTVEQLIANLEQRPVLTAQPPPSRRPLVIGLSVGGAAIVVGLAVGLGLAF